MLHRPIYVQKILPFVGKPVIKILTGIRRSGKSSLLRLVMEFLTEQGVSTDAIIYINKDSLEFEFIQNYRQLYDYVKSRCSGRGKTYVFVDEVQEISEWERAIGSLFTENQTDLYLTGSNAGLLSSELATLLTGRYVEIPVQTLVFSEFLQFRSAELSNKTTEFAHFLKYGGFPGIHQMEFSEEPLRQYLDAIYSTVILKDVISRNQIRDAHLLERIARYAADNIGNITTAKRIAQFLKSQHIKSSVDTVINYLKWLCDAMVLEKVNRSDIKGKGHLELYEKYYLSDIGLLFVLSGNRLTDISGKLENLVYLELKSRGYRISIGKLDQQEIDFVAEKNQSKIYIQVTYLLADAAVIEREFGVLEAVPDSYPKYVLSLDTLFAPDRNGIRWMNLVDFLVNREEL